MKKVLLSIVVLSLIAPVFMLFGPVSVEACPVKEPETLLSLYNASDAIHVARYTGEVQGEPAKPNEDSYYMLADVEKSFDVFTTLKGESVETVKLTETRYIYEPEPGYIDEVEEPANADDAVEPEEAVVDDVDLDEVEEIVEDDDALDEMRPGEDVLIFVKEGENGKLELADYRDGLKRMPRADLSVYEDRIKELGPIMAAEKPDAEKIVDWLIRCSQDKVTRWEGTYELERSFLTLEFQKAREAEEKEKQAEGEPANQFIAGLRYLGYGNVGAIEYAQAVNEYHRQTLTSILLTGEFTGQRLKKQNNRMDGDRELVSLVARWGGPQIAQVLGERLKSGAYTAWDNHAFMLSIVSIVKDKQLGELAEKYSDISYQSDNDAVDEEDAAAVTEKAVTDSSETAPESAQAKSDAVENKAEDPELPAVQAKKPIQTYRQLRADLIAQFLARADAVMFAPPGTVAENK